MKLAEKVKIYFQNLPEKALHVVLDNYSPGNKHIYLQNQPKSIKERKISGLIQQLAKIDEWQDFLSSQNEKFQVIDLSDYLLEKASLSKDIYVSKEQFC